MNNSSPYSGTIMIYPSQIFSVQGELWNAPCPSPIDDLTTAYFNNVIAKKHSIIIETHKEIHRIHDTATIFLK